MSPTKCARCAGSPKRATEQRTFSIGSDHYEIALCDTHAMAFDRDLGAWARLAREIDRRIAVRGEFTREREIDRAVASHFAPKHEQLPLGTVHVRKLPAGVHVWHLTDHAAKRCVERNISTTDALLAAADPAYAHPDPKNSEYWIHHRGEIQAIVVRHRRVIVTVTDQATRDAKREREAVSG